ncbi:MAG TPA: hypothetical protein VHQ90_08130 [Thermoanaerobaculia bacterium]|nr:hypothetical protein [Thermoanaerobaculia bacterium]
MITTLESRSQVASSLDLAPIIAVVRTASTQEAERQAHELARSGIELIEITFTVPDAPALVRRLLAERAASGPPWIGMGTVTTAARAREAGAAGAEFFVTPNVNETVARQAREAGLFLVMGALSPSEIVAAHELGADLVKVYPLPPVGGPAYLSTVRQPLGDIRMLAAGGFSVEEITAYRRAGAAAFGIGFPLLAGAEPEGGAGDGLRRRIAHALALARGREKP